MDLAALFELLVKNYGPQAGYSPSCFGSSLSSPKNMKRS